MLAGLAGLTSAGLWFASMLFGHAVTGPQALGASVTDAQVLQTLHEQSHRQLLSSGAGALHLQLVVPVGLYLVSVLQRRGRPVKGAWLSTLIVCVVPVLAALTLAAHFEVQNIASTFLATGPRTVARAHQLLAGSGTLAALRVVDELARLAFAGWVGAVSLGAIETGLMTRQLGYFGLGTAVATVMIPPAGDALFIGLLLAISSLALGYWPGGRPPAWGAGATAPWNATAIGSAR